jgi:hypothetical protein
MSPDDPLERLIAEQTRLGASDEERAAHHLILTAALDPARQLTEEELTRIVRHIAAAGFDPNALERVRGNVVRTLRLRGEPMQPGDRLPPAEAHYLRHCVAQREWPSGTTLLGYLDSIARLLRDPASRFFVSRYQAAWQCGAIGPNRMLRGPEGKAWILVDYRLITGHWVTAFQWGFGPEAIGDPVHDPRREEVRWLN